MGSKLKKIIALFISVIILFGMVNKPINVHAHNEKIVKVGWFTVDLFQNGKADDSYKSGYSYDYLQKIANYTDWTYQYVEGDWNQCLEMLKNGEIDVLSGVSITKERQTFISYPSNPMGVDNYWIYQHADNPIINASDLSTFDNKTIGAIYNNQMSVYLEKWALNNNVNLDIRYYNSFEERDLAFKNHELDSIVATNNNIDQDSRYSPVILVGQEDYYLAVSKKRNDLLDELNDALSLISEMDPFLIETLEAKYYNSTLASTNLTDKEINYLNSHSTLTIGYLDNYMPYCKKDSDGNASGLLVDVVNKILETLKISDKLSINYVAYSSYLDMINALKYHQINISFPVNDNLYFNEINDINATSPVVSAAMDLVCNGDYNEGSYSTFAVNKNNTLQELYIKSVYSDAIIKYYNSIDECLKAVKENKVDATIINGLRADLVRKNNKYTSLSLFQLSTNDIRCFGVNNNDSALYILLNRGLIAIGSNYGTNASYKYIDEFYQQSFLDIIVENFVAFGIVLFTFFGIIILCLSLYLSSTRKSKKKLETANDELKQSHDEVLKAKNAAIEASSAKTSFLFNMSHDIRTPMNAIMGFTELLKENQDDKEKRDEYIEKISSSSSVLLSIINNVLEMSRIEKGSIKIEETPYNIVDFSKTIDAVFVDMMRNKNITYKSSFKVIHKNVFCDPTKLKNIFINLISNAYKYTNENGTVTVDLIELPSNKKGYGLYKTIISDTGIGMSEDYLPHIFEEFSREYNTTASKVEGTGLGMSIVKRLVELLEGTISISSRKGVGTTVVVTLPHKLANSEDVKTNTISIETQSFENKRILLAEDNDFNAEITIELLKKSGFIVDRAIDGKECFNIINETEAGYYDLILMDIQMPNLNGYEATKAIRHLYDKGKAFIPIVAITANAFEEDKAKAIEVGMNGHLAKPVNLNELLTEIARNIK